MSARFSFTTAILLSAALSVGAQTTIQIGDATGAPEDTVNLPVILTTDGNTVCALSLEIRYDESKLVPAAPELGAHATAAGKQVIQSLPLPGVLRLGLYGMNQTALASGAVADVRFTIRANASGSTLLTTTCAASDCGGNAVTAESNTALVTISSTAGTVHPADVDDDWRMEISEVTSYGAAWKSGATWERPPNPIPIDYVTKAGQLWKSGEVYHFDGGADPPWTSGSSRLAERVARPTGTALRESRIVGGTVEVTIRLLPGGGTQACAVEESLPEGWSPAAVGEGGAYDPASRTIRWGPFLDAEPRVLRYSATAAEGALLEVPLGTASFDGISVSVARQDPIRENPPEQTPAR